jgi:hypothetical protein
MRPDIRPVVRTEEACKEKLGNNQASEMAFHVEEKPFIHVSAPHKIDDCHQNEDSCYDIFTVNLE